MKGNLVRLKTVIIIFILPIIGRSQPVSLSYYLPNINYDANVSTPEEFFGFQIGDWHLSHDQIVAYCKQIAFESDRVELQMTGKTHEGRSLMVLHISSPTNLINKESIRKSHLALTDTGVSSRVDIAQFPAVLYQGYSVHGNESSGVNAVPLVLYYLAAGQDDYIIELLNNVYILLDPCYNPDGVQRFSNWVNTHKSKNLVSDPQSREFHENWPGGRTNHYWFDLNRDWLLLTHPESESRMKTFHAWKPNVLTDHHEMGTNSTFFFQPGVPSRTNPNTPSKNQELTERIGEYHAKALDEIGSQYFTKSRFDDFYYGKGSTYPDIHGSIGILFEQASSRGHLQESENGLLSFPFTIRNQVKTSLSTQKATLDMREELLNYMRDFYHQKRDENNKRSIKAYTFTDTDHAKLTRFVSILLQHDIEIFQNMGAIDRLEFFVPTDQKQTGLVKTIFETVTSFQDSVFYDVSTWTMPLAFDLSVHEVNRKSKKKFNLEKIESIDSFQSGELIQTNQPYAWIFDWSQHDAPMILSQLLKHNIKSKISTIPLEFEIDNGKVQLDKGAVIIPLSNQSVTTSEIRNLLDSLVNGGFTKVFEIKSGYGSNGLSVGNPKIKTLKKKEYFTLVGDGIRSYDVGEVWHFFDVQLNQPISLLDINELDKRDLNRYTTLVVADGNYKKMSENVKSKLENWIKQGGEVITMRKGITLLEELKVISLNRKSKDKKDEVHILRQYQAAQNNQGADVLGGAIFKSKIDLSHPLAIGYNDDEIPLFRKGTTFYETPKNSLSAPLVYGEREALHSGYVPRGITDLAEESPAATLHTHGKGRMICFSDNLLFRGYWWGTHRLFSNAIFFIDMIDNGTMGKM